jgi:hypothetical protein
MTRGLLRRGVVAAAMSTSLAVAGISAVQVTAALAATAPSCPAAAVGQVGCGALTTPGSSTVTGSALRTGAAIDAAAAAPAGLAPVDVRGAYGLWASAITGGVGQTVAVVTAYDDATAESDITTYRSQYNLPACTTANKCFSKVDQNGGTNFPPAGPAGWSLATAQSLDMISAACPNCHILLVEAGSTAITDLGQAENEAVALGAKFVTNTWFTPEATFSTNEPAYDSQYFDHPGVAITAPDGNGAGYGTYYPAASPDVIAVGGTTLTRLSTGARYWSETAWSGAGSGCSPYEAKPSWQTDTGCSDRMLNDVSAVADPSGSPVAFYDTPSGGWVTGGGDNAAAAAIVAASLAVGGAPAAGTLGASYLYAHPGDFYDTTTGTNGTCSPAYYCTAGAGYDGPAGLGTPDGGIGPVTPDKSLPGAEAIFNPASGNLEVYGISSSRALVERYWHPGNGWSPGLSWAAARSPATPPQSMTQPAATWRYIRGRPPAPWKSLTGTRQTAGMDPMTWAGRSPVTQPPSTTRSPAHWSSGRSAPTGRSMRTAGVPSRAGRAG